MDHRFVGELITPHRSHQISCALHPAETFAFRPRTCVSVDVSRKGARAADRALRRLGYLCSLHEAAPGQDETFGTAPYIVDNQQRRESPRPYRRQARQLCFRIRLRVFYPLPQVGLAMQSVPSVYPERRQATMKILSRRGIKLTQRKLNILRFVRSKSRRSTAVDSFSRHPITLLVVGFLLTGVIGSWISYIKQRGDEASASRAATAEHFRVSMDAYESNLGAWVVRARTLDDSISNQLSSLEIEHARDEYDKAYINLYGSVHQLIRAEISLIPNSEKTDQIGDFLASGLLGILSFDKFINTANDCLRSMYLKTQTQSDRYDGPCNEYSELVSGSDGVSSYTRINWDHQKIEALIAKTGQCGSEIVASLRPTELDNSNLLSSSDEHAFDKVNEACELNMSKH